MPTSGSIVYSVHNNLSDCLASDLYSSQVNFVLERSNCKSFHLVHLTPKQFIFKYLLFQLKRHSILITSNPFVCFLPFLNNICLTYFHHLRDPLASILTVDLYELRKLVLLKLLSLNKRVCFLTVSHATAESIYKHSLIRPKCFVKYNPLPFHPNQLTLASRTSDTRLNNSNKWHPLKIIFVARYCKRKCFPKLVDYLHYCYVSSIPFTAILVTNSDGMEVFKMLISKYSSDFISSIRILVSVTDHHLANLYSEATCLICTSDTEGFFMPLFEAIKYDCIPILPRINVFKNELLGDTYPFYADCQEEFMSCVTNLSNPSLRKLAMLHFKETLALVS